MLGDRQSLWESWGITGLELRSMPLDEFDRGGNSQTTEGIMDLAVAQSLGTCGLTILSALMKAFIRIASAPDLPLTCAPWSGRLLDNVLTQSNYRLGGQTEDPVKWVS